MKTTPTQKQVQNLQLKNKDQSKGQSRSKQKTKNPPRKHLTRAERAKARSEAKETKEKMTAKNHLTPPITLPPENPAQNMNSDPHSDAEKIRKMWTNLDNDFAYSGNSSEIMNKIKSFRFDITRLFSFNTFVKCTSTYS